MIPDRLRTALEQTYRIERELGAGGMATVYLARDVKHGRDVALKVLRRDLAAVLGPERFLAEIRTTANLQHPHIVGLIDSGQVDGDVFYVMPYLAGESLRDRLQREKQLPVDDALRITTEVAQALDYAHRQGIIHRDIKPENILLQDGQAMVADFGIALAATQAVGGRMTETGMSLGTPQYMSPEQALGERTLTPQSDQYALACVLYELLAGEPPFTGPTVQAIVARVMSAEPEAITTRRSATPAAVAAAIGRALQKVPADRFGSCGAFAAALRAPQAASGPVPASAGRAQARFVRMVPWTLAGGIAAAWATASLLPRGQAASSPESFVEFSIEAPRGGHIDGTREFAISPDGRRVAFRATDSSGIPRLFVRDVASRDSRVLPATENADSPFFSPDGDRLAFGHGGGITVIDLASGLRSQIARADPDGQVLDLWVGSWGPDDTLLVSVLNDSGLQIMKLASSGGKPRWLFGDKSRSRDIGSHLPGGLVAFTQTSAVDSTVSEMAILSLRTGEIRQLNEEGFEPRYTAAGELIYGRADGSVVARRIDLAAGRFTDQPRILVTGLVTAFAPHVWSAITGALVFQEAGSGSTSLVEVSAAGDEREVTQAIGSSGPRYSPDGRRVAFVRRANGGSTISVFSVADSAQLHLTAAEVQGRFPSWSQDGKALLFTGTFDNEEDIGIVPTDGSAPPVRLLQVPRAQRQPVATPDGRRFAFVDLRGDIGLFDTSIDGTGKLREIVAGTGTTERHPTFSPDGRWIAFTSFGAESEEEVYVSPYPGPGPRAAISAGGGREPVFHPDGRRLYYRSGSRLIEATLALTTEARLVSRRTLFDRPEYEPPIPGRNFDIHPGGDRFLFVKGVRGSQPLVVRVPVASPARR